jgi:hypothetical protein
LNALPTVNTKLEDKHLLSELHRDQQNDAFKGMSWWEVVPSPHPRAVLCQGMSTRDGYVNSNLLTPPLPSFSVWKVPKSGRRPHEPLST